MARNRLQGYRTALAARGLQATERLGVGGQFTIDSGFAAMQSLLQDGPRPTAVFVANDEMAIGAIQAVKAAGLSVPGDISIMGFDDQRIGRVYDPALTTVRVPAAEIGYRSMLTLGKVLNGSPFDERVILPTEIVVRASTAPYRRP
jgi:DNA-binding LacI/PurR family transcriptional regulator